MEMYELTPERPVTPEPRKNVCAYARVSSEKDTAEMSFENQIRAYTETITSRPEWNFMGVFADEGKSGTNIEKRTQFQLMMELAKAGKIDLILTKSLSRFARNVVDCLEAIRTLKTYGTEVFFETDNISSFDPKIEFVISVLAGLAEEEARNVSENVRWNIRRRFEQGQANGGMNCFLGYDRDKEGNLVINSYEAEIVRMIYRMYIFGSSIRTIARELEARGIKTITGNEHWGQSTINRILKNDTYTGGMTLQKTCRPDYHSKGQRLNKGEMQKYEVLNSHPAIITREDFDAVQLIIQERQNWRTEKTAAPTNSSEYTGMFVCGHCGKNFRFRWSNRSSSNPKRILVCASNVDEKICEAETIPKEAADGIIRAQIELITKNPSAFMKTFAEEYKKNPEFLKDKASLQGVREKIDQVKKQMADLADKTDEIAETVMKESRDTLAGLEGERIGLENKFHTIHNVEYRLERFRAALRKDIVEFGDIFDHVEVLEWNRWVFRIGKEKGTVGQLRPEFQGKHTYLIRKSKRSIEFGIGF